MLRVAAALGAVIACLCGAGAAWGAVVPSPYGADNFGRFFHIIPPGQAGVDNPIQAATFLSTGAQPAHWSDQRDLYTNLLYATPGLADADIGRYFPDATFGVKDGSVESTESPRDDVVIIRDAQFGLPHIYGTTRSGTMFGAGYAAAEDRLFFMDVLRHAGDGTLSTFAGGANR